MPDTTRPKRGQRFQHKRLLDLDAPVSERKSAECVVTGTRQAGVDIVVLWTYASAWDAGQRRAGFSFRLGDADKSVARWVPENGEDPACEQRASEEDQ